MNTEKEKSITSFCRNVLISFAAIIVILAASFYLIFNTFSINYCDLDGSEAKAYFFGGIILLAAALIVLIFSAKKYKKLKYEKLFPSSSEIVEKKKALLACTKFAYIASIVLFACMVLVYASSSFINKEMTYQRIAKEVWDGNYHINWAYLGDSEHKYKDQEALENYCNACYYYDTGEIADAKESISNVELRYDKNSEHLEKVGALEALIDEEYPAYVENGGLTRLQEAARQERLKKLESIAKQQQEAIKNKKEGNTGGTNSSGSKSSSSSKSSSKSKSYDYDNDDDEDEYYRGYYYEFEEFYADHKDSFSSYDEAEEYFLEEVY